MNDAIVNLRFTISKLLEKRRAQRMPMWGMMVERDFPTCFCGGAACRMVRTATAA
jgi:hypothetical protein